MAKATNPTISLPKDDARLKGCKPGDVLSIRAKTLPGDGDEEEGMTIEAEVQSIEKVAKSPPKPKPNPLEYVKGKNDGKMAKMGY